MEEEQAKFCVNTSGRTGERLVKIYNSGYHHYLLQVHATLSHLLSVAQPFINVCSHLAGRMQLVYVCMLLGALADTVLLLLIL